MASNGTVFSDQRLTTINLFSISLTHRKLVTPEESIRCQWIYWSPMEQFSWATDRQQKTFFFYSLTNGKLVTPVESIVTNGSLTVFITTLPFFQWHLSIHFCSLVECIGHFMGNTREKGETVASISLEVWLRKVRHSSLVCVENKFIEWHIFHKQSLVV